MERGTMNTNDIYATFKREELEEYTHAISDILCWCRGFAAATPDDFNRHPLGVGELTELNIKLKRLLREPE